MIPGVPAALVMHVWQSTAFAGVVWLLTLSLRSHHARVRYWLWVTATTKFLVPFSGLIALGSRLEWRTAPTGLQPAVSFVMDTVLAPPITVVSVPSTPVVTPWLGIASALWFAGVIIVLVIWWRQWNAIRAAARAATPLTLDPMCDACGVAVMASPAVFEPGVVGLWRPVLLVPDGLFEQMTPTQVNAVLAHEQSHIRNRDNLVAFVHMLVEAAFWFHPFVWWIERRLIDERERACDEDVLRAGHDPTQYAEGILAVCRLTVQTSLPCVAGVSGSDLRRRIETIMARTVSRELGVIGKALLGVLAIAIISGPTIAGVLAAPARRQGDISSPRLRFEVTSIKKSAPEATTRSMRSLPNGEVIIAGLPLRVAISNAYDFDDVVGLPSWITEDRYDVHVKPAGSATQAQQQQMWRSLLADRLRLLTHYESRDVPGYALVRASAGRGLGPQLKPATIDCSAPQLGRGIPTVEAAAARCGLTSANGFMASASVTMDLFASRMRYAAGRPVTDATGLSGPYALTLTFSVPPPAGSTAPPTGTPDAPDVFTALQEQLGLKLQPATATIQVLVADHIERPTED